MALDPEACYRAFASRDRRFDGRFVTAVVTTGVYCRPGCPARLPARRNVRFYPHAAAAEAAGFRPCLRCRPETAPGSAAWNGTSATVARALRLIDEGAMDEAGVEALAARLGVTSRWLRELFAAQLGASPLAVARTRRVHFARRLLDTTDLPLVDIALASGFASARRLHDAFRATFHRSPGALRRGPAGQIGAIELRLPARSPFDMAPLLAFFKARAIPGVEHVTHDAYARTIRIGEHTGVIEARGISGAALRLGVRVSSPRALLPVAARVSRMFDLDADPGAIATHLRRDSALARIVPHAGVRVPGVWEPFEAGVRALLGQQISVPAARTLAGRLVRMCGTPLASAGPAGAGAAGSAGDRAAGHAPAAERGVAGPGEPAGGARPERDELIRRMERNPRILATPALSHLFPTPEAVAAADLERIGLPRARAASLRAFADAVASGRIAFESMPDLDRIVAQLTALPGVGPWTAHYVAMRALGEPDAFPASDLGVRKALARAGRMPSEREVLRRAERWRPWRAYAVIALWTRPEKETS